MRSEEGLFITHTFVSMHTDTSPVASHAQVPLLDTLPRHLHLIHRGMGTLLQRSRLPMSLNRCESMQAIRIHKIPMRTCSTCPGATIARRFRPKYTASLLDSPWSSSHEHHGRLPQCLYVVCDARRLLHCEWSRSAFNRRSPC